MTINNVTVVGNIASKVELRYTPHGTPVAQFSMAVNDRVFNEQTKSWEKNGEATFYRVSAWKHLGEHAAETLAKGMEVIANGRFTARQYEDKNGQARTSLDISVNPGKGALGPSLQWMTGVMSKAQPNAGQGQQAQSQPQSDPWNSAPQGGFSGGDSNPPF